MTRTAPPVILRFVFVLLIACLRGGAAASRKTFNIPAGDAIAMLKRFTTQSGEQLPYSTDMLAGVKTRAVKGELTPGFPNGDTP